MRKSLTLYDSLENPNKSFLKHIKMNLSHLTKLPKKWGMYRT